MKLGVSYNLFDGEELLEGSIKSIRKNVDYVSVVYQELSNYGFKTTSKLKEILIDLKNKKLVDEFINYTPNTSVSPQQNEINKRNIGLTLSLKKNCSHHMSMDTDEFYIESELASLKNIVKNENLDSSFCQMVTYYKSQEFILDPPESYFVPLIYKISKDSKYEFNTICPVETDPCRRILPGKFKIFDRDSIQMHHFSMVRTDIRKKLTNSSAKILFENNIEILVNHYENWEYPNFALWPGNPIKKINIKKIKPIL